MEFKKNEDNPWLNEQFNEDNYLVKDFRSSKSVCWIFFSGNGLYFPDDEEHFTKRIITEDYYEWQNITRNQSFIRIADRVIYIRDIYKSWYIKGINSQYDSVKKVAELLGGLTDGYKKVVTCGNSAGGYAAVLFGKLIGADYVYSFSGQFNLWRHKNIIETEEIVRKYSNIELYNQYFDLTKYIRKNICIYYFYAADCEEDVVQSTLVEGIKTVLPFGFSSKSHGVTVLSQNYISVFRYSPNRLIELSKKYKNKKIDKYLFYYKTGGIKGKKYYFYHLIRKNYMQCNQDVYVRLYLFPFDILCRDRKLKIVLYGAGKVGRSYVLQIVESCNLVLVGWCDANIHEYYPKIDINVIQVKNAIELDYDYIVLAVSSEKVANSIYLELMNYDINPEKILWSQPIQSQNIFYNKTVFD